ncbi:cytoplasmic polyadenylated homeobox-like protein 2 [Sciurus carolinensis]|uniref:cytoplasmic polyadenylated homeobox-like protein 2 n=1 Tax=Sciurus carolinensis TaxID=30640 RepID=UPI001FB523B6|nr:cytoplasmic polyadenylated homeobox-like protein 2 [Sciurus carolinensis]
MKEKLNILLAKSAEDGPQFSGQTSNNDKDDINNSTESKKSGKTKHRHKFSKEELQELHEIFTQTPYPDFTTREELALKFHCPVHVINNWFQNNRARLSPEERQRIFGVWKQQNYQVQTHQPFSNQVYSSSSFLKTQGLPYQQVGSNTSMVAGTGNQPGYTLEYGDDTESGPFANSFGISAAEMECQLQQHQPLRILKQMLFHQQLPVDQSHRDLGQQLPSPQLHLQGQFPQIHGKSLFTQLQPVPPLMVDSSLSSPLGQYMKQGTL